VRNGGGARVLAGLARDVALGEARRQALVVQLDRRVGAEAPREPRSEVAGLGGLCAVAAAQAQRQPDDHDLRLALGDQRGERAEPGARAGPQHRLERRDDRLARVADRDAGAGAAEVECENPH
jgi:hypothetical protein